MTIIPNTSTLYDINAWVISSIPSLSKSHIKYLTIVLATVWCIKSISFTPNNFKSSQINHKKPFLSL